MRGQHELQRHARLELLGRNPVELRKRVGERLRRNALLALVLAPPADAMLLLGDVRQLEIEREGPQHARLPLDRQRGHTLDQLVVRRPGAGRARECPHALDVLEQRLVLLLDEHPPEQVAEQADVAP